MNANIKAVRYYDDGYRLGILIRDDERKTEIVPVEAGVEIRVVRFRTDEDVVTEYFEADVLKSLKAKIIGLGDRYGITEEARRAIA